jgi:hypothetical protein
MIGESDIGCKDQQCGVEWCREEKKSKTDGGIMRL